MIIEDIPAFFASFFSSLVIELLSKSKISILLPFSSITC